jgi:hypothetical protein
MATMTNEDDVRRVLARLREAPLLMPYLHYDVPFHALRKVLDGNDDRTRWALHVLCTRGQAEYLTHTSPDCYRAFATPTAPPPIDDEWMITR